MEWFKRHFKEGYTGKTKSKKLATTPAFDIDPWIEKNQAYARNIKALALKTFMAVLTVIIFVAVAYGFSLFSSLLSSAGAATLNPTEIYDVYTEYTASMSTLMAVDIGGVILIVGLYATVARVNKMSHKGTSWLTLNLTTSEGFERHFDLDKMDLRPVPITFSKKRLDEKLKSAKKGLSKEEQDNVDAEYAVFYDKKNPLHAFRWYQKDNKFYINFAARAANLDSLKIQRPEKHSIGFGSEVLPHMTLDVVDRSPYTEPYVDTSKVLHYCRQCGEEIPEDKVSEEGKAICKCSATGKPRKVRDAHPIYTEDAPLLYILNMPCGAEHWIPTVAQDAVLKSLLQEPSLTRTQLDLSAERVSKADLLEGLRDKSLDERIEKYPSLPSQVPIGKTDEEEKKEETLRNQKKQYNLLKITVAAQFILLVIVTAIALV